MKNRLIATLLMSLGLSLLMSCWVTFLNLGWSDRFFWQWMNAFRLAWPAAAVIAFFLGPPVQRATLFLSARLP
ncbi:MULTISPECIES: DUF2798 domain-containing protein [Stappiaceae]|uniref:DUF2798 domain-containing protein n=1 Tax=Stappiaceae TaxID=2821832 RepID=UPI00126904CA|nr:MULTISPECIES: DUF2798 domain-containing protein [Stappiaceae]QFT68559.1 hypothetical protein FIU93_17330 [Labrenzia sp. THAF35]UES39897.1 DUF2798 domain-containing protein [Roseibium aggregatum]UES58327.1 DUF2798 domain-containing protein [Roseibium aggregatum]